jgi:hypothetical protein
MKHRLGLLICGAVLLAAVPVWADKGPDSGSPGDFGGKGSGYSSGSLSFGQGPSSSSAIGVHSDGIGAAGGYSPSTNWVRASRDGEFGQVVENPTAGVAEPGSLPLILLGLVSVGFLVGRRGQARTSV